MEGLVPECWRDVIVAGRGRKSRATFGTPAIVSLRQPAAVCHKYRTGQVRTLRLRRTAESANDFPRIRPQAGQAHFRAPSFDIFASLS
jgi:hypothetical protein